MFDLGWQEFMLIALIAVIVVGPKDLPRVVRTVGQWIRKARSLAGEFQSSFEEIARESELDDVRKQVQQVSRDGLSKTVESHIDPEGDLRQSVEDAKAASGADEIEEEMRGLQRDTKAIAGTPSREKADSKEPRDPVVETAEDYAAKFAAVKIPGNSIHPPVEDAVAAATTPTEAAPAPAAPKAASARKPAAKKAPAKRTAVKPTAKPAPKTRTRTKPAADNAPASKA